MVKSRIKEAHKVRVDQSILDKFEALPITRSAAIGLSILQAGRKPDLLHMALRRRMSETRSGNNVRISYTRDDKVADIVDVLAEMSDLANEEVIRLCMEAYIHRL